jgi:hypothetical protein
MPTSRPTRAHFRSLRLTPGELAVIRGKARAAGLPVSTYLRQVALGKKVRVRRGQVRRDTVYQLIKVGTNINQLARAANTAGQVVALELLEAALQELRRVLDKLDR